MGLLLLVLSSGYRVIGGSGRAPSTNEAYPLKSSVNVYPVSALITSELSSATSATSGVDPLTLSNLHLTL